MRDVGDLGKHPMNWRRWFSVLGEFCITGARRTRIRTSEMRTLFYIFAICLAALFLFVTVNRLERNRPLAILLMILILGVTAAAVLKQLMP
jgi:hypothetical protein